MKPKVPEKEKIPLYDFHCHVAEGLAWTPPALFHPPKAENAENMLSYFAKDGVERLNIPAITLYHSADIACNPLALYAKTLAPDRIYAMAGLKRFPGAEKEDVILGQAKNLMDAGFDGIKMLCKPNIRKYYRYPINDPVFNKFYAEAELKGWPIIFHVADPATFWDREKAPPWAFNAGWFYGDSAEIPPYEQFYTEVYDVLERFPNITFIFAHFFFLADNLDKLRELLGRYPRICLDLTPGSEMYESFSRNREAAKAFFTEFSDRILFGTDNSGASGKMWDMERADGFAKIALMRRFFETSEEIDFLGSPGLRGLALEDAVLKKVYNGNFTRLLGNKPKAVEKRGAAAICAACSKLIDKSAPFAADANRVLNELKWRFG